MASDSGASSCTCVTGPAASVASGSAASTSSPASSATRRASVRNSNDSKAARMAPRRSASRVMKGTSAGSTSTGTFTSITDRSRHISAVSANSMRFWRRLGVCSSAWARISSRVPYFSINCAAVFSPMPGTPGRLSLESPIMPRRSGMRPGSTPYRSRTFAGS